MPPPAVLIALPFHQKGETSSARSEIHRLAGKRGWEYDEIWAKRRRVNRKNLDLLNTSDARTHYRKFHERQTAVLTSRLPVVRITKNLQASGTRTFRQFAAYKAYLPMPEDRWREDPEGWFADFECWLEEPGCEDNKDPRCLPFHIFASKCPGRDLRTQSNRKAFTRDHRIRRYGQRSFLRDAEDLDWDLNPRVFHAHDTVESVAGTALPLGHHWDVTKADGTEGRKVRLWDLKNEHVIKSHLNVYPSGFIRPPGNHGN